MYNNSNFKKNLYLIFNLLLNGLVCLKITGHYLSYFALKKKLVYIFKSLIYLHFWDEEKFKLWKIFGKKYL